MTTKKKRYIPRPVQKLVEEMGMQYDDDYTGCWTVECGLHSGIPRCCIVWYVMAYLPAIQTHELIEDINTGRPEGNELSLPGDWTFLYYSSMLRRYEAENNIQINYIPCPACFLARRFVRKLKRCDCHRKRTYPLLH
jgi:hypothetical protein